MARRGTRLVCTSSVMRAAGASPEVVPFMRERFRQVSEDYVATMARVRARGLAIAVGCDTHHASLAEELETLLEAGYTSAEALRAATLGGATLCGQADRVGTLEPGKLADFIAVAGDPLGDPPRALRNVRSVFKGGARQPV
jgi:imidazolonepropionase-like amidohydrolase